MQKPRNKPSDGGLPFCQGPIFPCDHVLGPILILQLYLIGNTSTKVAPPTSDQFNSDTQYLKRTSNRGTNMEEKKPKQQKKKTSEG